MFRSQVVAEHLPLLRRYARALTGNQASGDAYVGAMLEALLQDQTLLDERHGPRAGCSGYSPKIWNSVSINDDADDVPTLAPTERRLTNITPLPRQAFLLLSLEGFSEEEVAFILEADIAEVRKLSGIAGREMAAEIATDVLIIEDETFIAMDLESLVKNLGHRVIGVARTHADAIALAKTKKPGLILADIQLADGSSGIGRRQRTSARLRGARCLHNGLSRTLSDRRATRAGVPHLETVPARHGLRGSQPGAVLSAEFAQPGTARRRILIASPVLLNEGDMDQIHVAYFGSGSQRQKRRTRLASPAAASSSPVDRGRGKTGCQDNARRSKAFRLLLFLRNRQLNDVCPNRVIAVAVPHPVAVRDGCRRERTRGEATMFQVSAGVLGVLAVILSLGAVHLASGRITPPAMTRPFRVVNRAVKSDRGNVSISTREGRTVSIRLESLPDTSIVFRIPRSSGQEVTITHEARLASTRPRGAVRRTIACEPVVSALTDVAKQLQPGRCVT